MIKTKLDPKEEREYDELRRMGQRLHIPIPEAFWKLEVFDKNGKLLQTHDQRSHSWTRNAYNQLFCAMASKNASDATWVAGKLSGKDTAGVVHFGAAGIMAHYNIDIDTPDATKGILTPANQKTKGIQVGSGINAESFDDFVLQTLINSGAGAGEINYAASELHDITYVGTVLSDAQVRYFNNNSGGDIAVNEVSIVNGLYYGANLNFYLTARDHLGATITVPDTGQLKVTYTIQLTYPV